MNKTQIQHYLTDLNLPSPGSHKGQNGKLLIIGGSELFHAASRWSLDIASKLVDMIFYTSVPSNNQLILEAKKNFWNGIVVAREDLEDYIHDADCILIGPGMMRHQLDAKPENDNREYYLNNSPTLQEWQDNTQKIVNYLLSKYPNKKWVIDAGALQMMNPNLLTNTCIITPHLKELKIVINKLGQEQRVKFSQNDLNSMSSLSLLNKLLNNALILLKGQADVITHGQETYEIKGGNAGMTKGGTGDVLAGLVAGLYTTNQILPSAIVASYINKIAGEILYQSVGPFYNASDLLNTIPRMLWEELKQANS